MKEASRVIIENNNQVLIGLRGPGFEQNKWNIIGGKPNPGESKEAAARREALEEAGVEIQTLTHLFTRQNNGWTSHYFLARLTGDVQVAMRDNEHDELRWVTEAQLDTLEAFFAFDHYIILKDFFMKLRDT